MSTEKCYHCGDDCGHYPVIFDEKYFCCKGCKSVYEILNKNKLYKYYQIEPAPGTRISTSVTENKYDYLNNEEIQKKLLDFSDGKINKITLFIPSIHCSSCIWLLENLNNLHEGIKFSKVNFTHKKVFITYDNEKISLKEIAEILESISYTPNINIDDSDKKKNSDKYNRTLIIKLGIAGFCFGNIMLLSFPEYFSEKSTEISTVNLFRWLNLFLSFPVVFYSANVFFKSAFKNLIKGNINIDLPVAIGIITIFIRSIYEILSNTGPGYMDSMTGLVFFLLIGRWYQNKTYQTLSFDKGLRSYLPLAATVKEGDKEMPVPINKLKKGDLLIIRNKELIPVDCLLIEGTGNIDYSFVSGESLPVTKEKGEMLFAGGRQIGNIITVEVLKEVSQSYFTQLWNQIDSENQVKSVKSIVNVISRYFIASILIIAATAFIYWSFTDMVKAFNAFTSVLIIACPCALALSAPFTFGAAMRMLARSGFFLRDTEVIESLSECNTIVFDKTGTITKNDQFDILYHGSELSKEETIVLKSLIRHSSHPLSLSIFNFLPDYGITENTKFKEITGKGIRGEVNGYTIFFGSPQFTGFNDVIHGGTIVCVLINGNKKGYFECKNYYREGLKNVMEQLSKTKELHLLSGDNDAERERVIQFFPEKNIRFNQLPEDKLKYIKQLQQENKNVLMIGDGLNDAGALQQSNTGISIADNIYHFSPACDAILIAKKFKELVRYISFSKTAMKILYTSFIISFLYNIIGLSFAFSGKLEPVVAAVLMPISSVSVVAFATITINLLAKTKKII